MEVRSIEAIVKALNRAKVRYLIVGGLAVNAHGFVRLTRDVDIVLHLKKSNVVRGLDALHQTGFRMAIPEKAGAFADAKTRERWRREKNGRNDPGQMEDTVRGKGWQGKEWCFLHDV